MNARLRWTTKAARPYFLLFVLLNVVYHSNLRPVASGDSLPASLIPFSILLDGSVALDRFGPYISEHVWYGSAILHQTGPHWYSVYPIAGPVLATPLYLPVALVPWIARQPPGTLIVAARVAEKVVAVVLAAAAAIALLLLLRRLTSNRSAWMLTLVFALGTASWSTASQALWQHTFGQLAIIGCLYSIQRASENVTESRWYWCMGAYAACALAIRPTNLALLPALALVLWPQPGRLMNYVRVFTTPAVVGVFMAAYNFAVFHRFGGGYPATLEWPVFGPLLGILLSPGRGLLVYTPIAVFAFAAFAPRSHTARDKHQLVVRAALAFSILHILLISSWPVWWGGYCWGPRLLTEILAPVMVLIAVGMPAIQGRTPRSLFAITAVYCFLIQALGVYCYPKGRWDHLPVSVNAAPGRLWDWADNPVIRTARGGIAWEPYSIVAAMARGGIPAAAKELQKSGINPF